jgi:hypothetical protein
MDSLDPRTLIRLFAVTAMLFCGRLEGRSHWFVLAFAGACAFGWTLPLIELLGLISGGVPPGPGLRLFRALTFNQFTHREAPQ